MFPALFAAAHRATRAVLGHEATVTVDGTAYSVQLTLWEPPHQVAVGGGLDAVDVEPYATVLHSDLDDAEITPGVDTVRVGSRLWLIQAAKLDSVGGLRLTLSGG